MLTRMSAVAALRGSTWADDRVFDSDNTPLSQALTLNAAAKPYIVVYTDSDSRVDQNGTDVYGMTRELNLVLEIGVASKVEVGAPGIHPVRGRCPPVPHHTAPVLRRPLSRHDLAQVAARFTRPGLDRGIPRFAPISRPRLPGSPRSRGGVRDATRARSPQNWPAAKLHPADLALR